MNSRHVCVVPLTWARRGHSKVARFSISEEQGRGGVGPSQAVRDLGREK